MFQITGGDNAWVVDRRELAEKSKLPQAECDDALGFLDAAGLVERVALGGKYAVTHRGVIEFESQLSAVDVQQQQQTATFTQNFNAPVGVVQQGNNRAESAVNWADVVSLIDAIRADVRHVSIKEKEGFLEILNDISEEVNGKKKASKIKSSMLALVGLVERSSDVMLKVMDLAARIGVELNVSL
jgi:hypothetical protein